MIETTPERPVYFVAHGLLFRSPFLIPGAIEANPPGSGREPDVEIVFDAVPLSIGDNSGIIGEFERQGANILTRIPDIGRFLVQGGSRIMIDAPKNVEADMLRAYVGGPVLAVLLHQRRAMPLHASCVARNGRAIALVGSSGAGKSTTAALFGNCGYDIVCDDLLTGEWTENSIIVHPANRTAKLWNDAAGMLGVEDTLEGPMHSGVAKKVFDPDPDHGPAAQEQRLDAVLVLRWIFPQNAETQMHAVSPLDALGMLRQHIFRNTMIRAFDLEGDYMTKLAQLVRLVPVHVLARPYCTTKLPDIPDLVAEGLGYQ